MCFNLRHLFLIWLVKIPLYNVEIFFFWTQHHFSLTILWVWGFVKVPIRRMYKSFKKNTNWQLCPITPHHFPSCRAGLLGGIIPHVHKTDLSGVPIFTKLLFLLLCLSECLLNFSRFKPLNQRRWHVVNTHKHPLGTRSILVTAVECDWDTVKSSRSVSFTERDGDANNSSNNGNM